MPKGTSSTTAINGFTVRAFRKQLQLSMRELASVIGKDRTYLVKIETGAVSRVSDGVFNSLLNALGIEDRRALMAYPHAETEEDAA